MVLCAGPTGSGKTTTLYATLSEVNDPTRNIMTIEDPVEYVFPSINQIQTNEQAGLTFATGLKSILRQDPDVILVGEIRDVETARDRRAVRPHRPLRALVPARHRLGLGPAPLPRHGDRVLPDRLVGARRSSASAWSGASAPRARPLQATDEELAFYEESGGPRKGHLLPGRRAATSAPAPATRTASASTSSSGSPRRSSG